MPLDWPVRHGGTVVLSAEDERFEWVPGTEEDRRYRVASVTKLMTALATVAAVEAGKLALDTAVPGVGDGVTVRHLLAHAAGLPFDPGGSVRPAETRRIYSNVGYQRVAEVVAGAVGAPFPAWLDDAVLRPLGMTATTLEEWNGVPENPAAGAHAPLADLALLAGCLLDRGAPVIGPELFAEAVSVQFPGLAGLVPGVGRFDPCDWGLGPELKDGKSPHWMGGRRSPSSFGHFGGSGCFLWVDPDAGLAAAAVTDRDFDDDRWAMATWPAWSDAIGDAIG
jgi:CubicO group peptidase (beta-lactamase class C family)